MNLQNKMCLTKESYSTKEDAMRIKNVLTTRYVSLNVYKCPFCLKYHIGNKNKGK